MTDEPKTDLTAERLREMLHYDPKTGWFTWRVSGGSRAKKWGRAGAVHKKRREICIFGKRYQEHHLAWLYMTGSWPGNEINHIDHSVDNNKWDNLREATRSENIFSKGMYSNNTSGFKGVSFRKREGKFQAKIGINGRTIHLGYFSTAEEAHSAYCAAAAKYHGEFARTE